MIRKQSGHLNQDAGNELGEVPDMGYNIAFWEAVKPFSHPPQAKDKPAAGHNSKPHPEDRAEAGGKPSPSVGESAKPGKIPGNKSGKGL